MNSQTSVYNEDSSLKIVDVSKLTRFFNFVVDYIAIMLFAIITVVIIGIIFGEQGIKYLRSYPDFIFGLLIYLIYYIVFEAITGRTLGKYVTGTQVVNELGEIASFKQILGRSICRLIPFEPLSFFGAMGRGWHDSIPDTSVTKCR